MPDHTEPQTATEPRQRLMVERRCCKCGEITVRPKGRYLCVSCTRLAATAWRQKRRDAGIPVRKYYPERARAYNLKRPPRLGRQRAEATPLQKSYYSEKYKRTRDTAPEKLSAKNKVKYAVKSGALTKAPCEVCGNSTVHAHHDDYSKPLDVRWLCPLHHRQHHAAEYRARRDAAPEQNTGA